VRSGLHDHAALDAEVLVQCEQGLLGRVGRHICGIGTEGEFLRRAEDVKVRVTGAARQSEARFRRTRIERWFRLGHDAGNSMMKE
jgi:hypothetical protein